MSITLVQSNSGATTSLAFGVNVTAGNLLIVVAASNNSAAATFSISDTLGNVFSSLAVIDNTASGGGTVQLFYVKSLGGADTVSLTTGSANPILAIHEFSGVDTFDVQNSSSGFGNSQDSGVATTNNAVELIFGYILAVTAGTIFSLNAGVGFTQGEKVSVNLLTEYETVAAIGSYSASTSTTSGKGTVVSWTIQVATFYLSSAPVVSNSDYWLGQRQHSTKIILPGSSN